MSENDADGGSQQHESHWGGKGGGMFVHSMAQLSSALATTFATHPLLCCMMCHIDLTLKQCALAVPAMAHGAWLRAVRTNRTTSQACKRFAN